MLASDGLRVTWLARALVAAGSCKLGWMQNELALCDSEFEPLVFRLLCPVGMDVGALRRLAS
jgi:hypothetical protein